MDKNMFGQTVENSVNRYNVYISTISIVILFSYLITSYELFKYELWNFIRSFISQKVKLSVNENVSGQTVEKWV